MDDVREYNRRYHKLDWVKRKRVLRNTVTKRENQKKEEKQKRKGEHYSGGMGLNEDTAQSALNIGRRQNKRRNIVNGLTVQGGKKLQSADDARGRTILSIARNVRTIRTINPHQVQVLLLIWSKLPQ
jgi:hypothetical protein